LQQDRLLIFLGLGLGIVELRESSMIINAVKFGRQTTPSAAAKR
jgi:hypothetical protein